MDFTLSEEQKMVQKTVRSFISNEVMPLEHDILKREREGRGGITREEIQKLQKKAQDLGFWGINTPEEYGGAELGPVMTALIQMELGRTFIPFVFGGEADNILFQCNEEQKKEYLIPVLHGEKIACFALTEPDAGSDANNIKMSAIKDGDHFILNGEKTFITKGDKADFAMVFAVTDKEKGSVGGVTCFLVDRSMGWYSEYIHTMGEWGTASLVFENVRVPEKNILGELGNGFELSMQWIRNGRWMIPALGLGASERMLQMAIDYSQSRITFGKPISERQAIQWMIADSAVEIEATKWLLFKTAWMEENNKDNRHISSIVKLFGANMANQVADRVMQIHGGMGYSKELPIERWYRDMRVWRIFEGTDEIQRHIIARNLLKGHVKIGELLD